MTYRRSFIKKSLGLAGAFSFSSLAAKTIAEDISDALLTLNKQEPFEAAKEEELWERIAQSYTASANLINLNNAGVSPQPKIVQDTLDRFYRFSNEGPGHYMWHILERQREMVRRKLAELAGTSSEVLAINRNTTEALSTVTYGLAVNKGDEIVMARQDYPNMIQAWKQKEIREGIKINWINFNSPIENEESILNSYIESTTQRTKIWHVSHIINWTGQILPVKKLCEEARRRGIVSIVDGAQTFGHLDFKISDIDPDYYATSLHKWLCGPFGTGMLYVKKENIANLWPLFSSQSPQSDNIRKFEVLGTRSSPSELAISQAIDFHNAIGSKRKEERLRFLKNYWCEKISKHPRVKLHVSLKPEYACGIGMFSIEGVEVNKIYNQLLLDYQILTVFIDLENINGIRVSPQVYTSTKDLDRFVDAVLKIASRN